MTSILSSDKYSELWQVFSAVTSILSSDKYSELWQVFWALTSILSSDKYSELCQSDKYSELLQASLIFTCICGGTGRVVMSTGRPARLTSIGELVTVDQWKNSSGIKNIAMRIRIQVRVRLHLDLDPVPGQAQIGSASRARGCKNKPKKSFKIFKRKLSTSTMFWQI